MLGAHYDQGSFWQAQVGLERHLAGGVAPSRYDLARADYEASQRARRLESVDGQQDLLPMTWLGRLLRAVIALASFQTAMPILHVPRRSRFF